MARGDRSKRSSRRSAGSKARASESLIGAAYQSDLALVHHEGFGHVATAAAEEVLGRLSKANIKRGLVVDLGCGSGILAHAVTKAGFDVLGFDISSAMLRLARRNAPRARFRRGSFLDAKLPPCVAVTAVGEVINYLFDSRNSAAQLDEFFMRVHTALLPGGLFMFDAAGPGRAGSEGSTRGYTDAPDWTCLYTATENLSAQMLTREVVTFRRAGLRYRRSDETHRLRLYKSDEILRRLRAAGFRARGMRGYANISFSKGWASFLAQKR